MRSLMKYQANDGTLFDNADEAVRRDALVRRCDELEALLPPHPDNSGERLKHDPAVLREYRREVVRLCRELFPKEPVFDHAPEEIHPFSWAGRFLSEAAPRCVTGLWWRLSCIADGYEYQQPFFALHPEEWKDDVGASK